MSSANELRERGDKLADKYSEAELKAALNNAVATNDNEERLSLQWALKQKTGEQNGYKFTKEQEMSQKTRLAE